MKITVEQSFLSTQNREVYLSRVLKENEKRELVEVSLQNGNLCLTFSDEEKYLVRKAVKQFSKTKYRNEDEAISKFQRSLKPKNGCLFFDLWREISVIDLPDVWLVFFKRIF